MRLTDPGVGLPAWLPENARLYLRHIEGGQSIRALARSEGAHASTVLRRVRRYENRRDDPLVDEALDALGRCYVPTQDHRAVAGGASTHHHTTMETTMTVALDHRPRLADAPTIEREARRILRRLCEAGTVLAIAGDLEKAAVMKGTIRMAVVDRAVAQAFALKDWIAVKAAGRVTTYEITGAGRAALKRLLAGDPRAGALEGARGGMSPSDGFAEQHRVWGERSLADESDGGRPRRVRYNLAESPLTALARRRDRDGELFLTPDLVAAGERLREDFELAQLGPRVTQNWDRFLTAGDRGQFGPESAGEGGSAAARDRVAAALRELGPGLGDMVLRCCCFLEGLEVAEKRMGWSARSGKIVLRIALMRLKRHYQGINEGRPPLIG